MYTYMYIRMYVCIHTYIPPPQTPWYIYIHTYIPPPQTPGSFANSTSRKGDIAQDKNKKKKKSPPPHKAIARE